MILTPLLVTLSIIALQYKLLPANLSVLFELRQLLISLFCHNIIVFKTGCQKLSGSRQ